jgi:hypothetical protein
MPEMSSAPLAGREKGFTGALPRHEYLKLAKIISSQSLAANHQRF